MTNEADIKHVIRDQNTVVNTIGSHIYYKKEKDFEDANINVPRAIAKVAAANPNVKRLIHISAAGADPNIQDDNDMSGVDMARRNIDRGDPFGFLGSTGLKVLENPSLANEMLEEVHKSEKNSKKCGVLCDAETWKSVA